MSGDEKWLSSKEILKVAKIQSCDLMHYRIQGKLEFKKKGNAYFYSKLSVENIIETKLDLLKTLSNTKIIN
tara:strand:+ start:5639 stop:5851 length:213 start_codon:yes stop_codon:yes gene_type:complete